MEEALNRYKKLGNGKRFLGKVNEAIQTILNYPDTWKKVDEIHRRYLVKKYPYIIVYEFQESINHVIIIAFSHQKRLSDYWRDRSND